jgi:hypothetical protein
MALEDEVLNRYSTQILVNLTNPQDSGAVALDATKFTNACADIQAEFLKKGMTYADTAMSIATAVEGVISLLTKRQGQTGGNEQWTGWMKDLTNLQMVSANDRIVPINKSPTCDSTQQCLCKGRPTPALRATCGPASFDGYSPIVSCDNITIMAPNPDWRANLQPRSCEDCSTDNCCDDSCSDPCGTC